MCLMDDANLNDLPFNKVVHSPEACTDCSSNSRSYCNERLCTVDNTQCKNYPAGHIEMSPYCSGECEIAYT
jgi:hypothetical protein